jgi:hypothetical protein
LQDAALNSQLCGGMASSIQPRHGGTAKPDPPIAKLVQFDAHESFQKMEQPEGSRNSQGTSISL